VRDAEVDQAGTGEFEEQVLRLDVAVDDALAVQLRERLQRAARDPAGGGPGQRPGAAYEFGHRGGGHVLGRHPGPRRVRVGVEDARGAYALGAPGDFHLAREAPPAPLPPPAADPSAASPSAVNGPSPRAAFGGERV